MQHSHPNNMILWNDIACQRGCAEHVKRPVRIELGGPTAYHDYTPIPTRFTRHFDMEVWNTELTPVDGGPYCPARDAVSETILSHGIWEPQETAILLCCFEQLPGGLFVDFGSQIGWFSTLAALSGMTVIALDADHDCVDLTYRNLARNTELLQSVGAYHERLSPDTTQFSLDDEGFPLPTVAKIDVEGAEVNAIRKLQPLIDEQWVKYLLIEISPVFNDSYEDLINGLVDDGFVPYLIPDKRTPPVEINQLADLISYEFDDPTPKAVKGFIKGLHQCNMFFVHGGIS